MATNTTNLNLIKPDEADFYNIQDFNDNCDKLDAEITKKANKVSNAVTNNFAALTADGDIADSGKKAADFATTSSLTTGLNEKANKVANPIAGNFVSLTDTGDIADSGRKPEDFATNTDMTGASATMTGMHGLVPAPKEGEQEKFLRGDGTWAALALGEIKISKQIYLSGASNTYDITDSLDLPLGKNTLFAVQLAGFPCNSATISYTVTGFKDVSGPVAKTFNLPAVTSTLGNVTILCIARFASGKSETSGIDLVSSYLSLK